LNISPDLKQEVHLFLRSYVGYLEAVKIQDLYLALVEKSKDAAELEENVKRAFEDAGSRGDRRLAETVAALNGKIKKVYF
jgi:hypothetical protein